MSKPRAAWDDWRDIRTIPPRTTVEVRTVTGLIRRARLAYPDTEPRYERRTKSIACWGIGSGDLKAVAWRPLPVDSERPAGR